MFLHILIYLLQGFLASAILPVQIIHYRLGKEEESMADRLDRWGLDRWGLDRWGQYRLINKISPYF